MSELNEIIWIVQDGKLVATEETRQAGEIYSDIGIRAGKPALRKWSEEEKAKRRQEEEEAAEPGPYTLTRATLWRRCRPEEVPVMVQLFETFEKSPNPVEVQLAMVFASANVLDSSDADFYVLHYAIASVLGEERANELLEPM